MKYVSTSIAIYDTKSGAIPRCSCGWQDYPFHQYENAWRAALLHLSFDYRHAGDDNVARWAREELQARELL